MSWRHDSKRHSDLLKCALEVLEVLAYLLHDAVDLAWTGGDGHWDFSRDRNNQQRHQ